LLFRQAHPEVTAGPAGINKSFLGGVGDLGLDLTGNDRSEPRRGCMYRRIGQNGKDSSEKSCLSSEKSAGLSSSEKVEREAARSKKKSEISENKKNGLLVNSDSTAMPPPLCLRYYTLNMNGFCLFFLLRITRWCLTSCAGPAAPLAQSMSSPARASKRINGNSPSLLPDFARVFLSTPLSRFDTTLKTK
jgi:hypothetical protein